MEYKPEYFIYSFRQEKIKIKIKKIVFYENHMLHEKKVCLIKKQLYGGTVLTENIDQSCLSIVLAEC